MFDRRNSCDVARRLRWRLAVVAAALAVCAGGAYLCVFNPANSKMYPPCLFRALTGFYCPGCGTLRAIHQLMHGNIRAALLLNPLAVVLLPFVMYGMASAVLRAIGLKPLPTVFVPAFWIWTLLAVILLYWVLRNIPQYPCSLLAPSVMQANEGGEGSLVGTGAHAVAP